MTTSELILRLQELDPSGSMEVVFVDDDDIERGINPILKSLYFGFLEDGTTEAIYL